MTSGGRETAGATTTLVVRYVREHAGDNGVARVLARSGVRHTADDLEDERRWFTYEEKIALFEAAAVELDDPDVTRHIGEDALRHQVHAGLRILLRTLGSPRTVISNVAKACPKFSTVASMDVVELGRGHAVVTYELHSGKQPHRLDCLLNQGLISVIGPLFGLPLLDVEHPECQVAGAPRCVYRVRWSRRRRGRDRREAHLAEQVSALAAQLEALQSTAADLVSTDDVSEVLARIVSRASVAVTAPRHLLAVRRETGAIEVHAEGFRDREHARAVGVELLSGRRFGDHVLVHDVVSARRHYGMLAAFYDDHSFFGQEQKLLAAYARNAAAALDVATSLAEALERGAENAALLDLASALAELASPEQVAQKTAEAMAPVVGSTATVVFLTEGERVVVRGTHGWSPDHDDVLRALVIDRTTDRAAASWLDAPGVTIVDDDSRSATGRAVIAALGVDALVTVPIRRRGMLLGVAGAAFDRTRIAADPSRLFERCTAVAGHAATAIDNARLLQRIRHQALHDDLTGVATRAHFEEEAQRALDRAARDSSEVTLVFLDLDRFKEANDEHGHQIGDVVLQEIGWRLRSSARSGDIVGRLGGDEFALMLWGAGTDDALRFAEGLRAAIEVPVVVGGREIRVSASVGVAAACRPGERYGDLLRRADGAMYRAKREGRNACRADLSVVR